MNNIDLIFDAIKQNITEQGIRNMFNYCVNSSRDVIKVMDAVTSTVEPPVIDNKILFKLCESYYSNNKCKVVSVENITIKIFDVCINVRVNTKVLRWCDPNNTSDWDYSRDDIHTKEIWKIDYDYHDITFDDYNNFTNNYTSTPVEEMSAN